MSRRKGGWIQTFTGRAFYPEDPRPEDVDVHDIAHALSMLCRFGGHANRFYSVAQHSVLVSYQVPARDALWGLLHDAAEAYIVDLPSPVKRSELLAGYRAIEERVMAVVQTRFELPAFPLSVGPADRVLLATEARDLLVKPAKAWSKGARPLEASIDPWAPWNAEREFLFRFGQLWGARA